MKFVFVACVVILIVSLGFNVYLYDSLNNRTNELQSQVAELTSQNANLQEQIDSQQSIIFDLQKENNDLQNQLNIEGPPNLVTSLGATDTNSSVPPNDPNPNPRLYIEGTVYNIGSETAYNCWLNVTLYRGEDVVRSAYIDLGTIAGGDSVQVSENIAYSGDPLTDWDIIPEWDTS